MAPTSRQAQSHQTPNARNATSLKNANALKLIWHRKFLKPAEKNLEFSGVQKPIVIKDKKNQHNSKSNISPHPFLSKLDDQNHWSHHPIPSRFIWTLPVPPIPLSNELSAPLGKLHYTSSNYAELGKFSHPNTLYWVNFNYHSVFDQPWTILEVSKYTRAVVNLKEKDTTANHSF